MKEMFDTLVGTVHDLRDIGGHAKNFFEILKALVPAGWVQPRILNNGEYNGPPLAANEMAETLRQIRNLLKGKIVSSEGRVNYRALRQSEEFQRMQELTLALQAASPGLLSEPEKLAFWLNLYNVLAIHGVIALSIRESVMEIPSFFHLAAYRVGDHVLTLDDIENGVLRKNAPHPAMKSRMFKKDDPRLEMCPSKLDPRIHAALVCASTSCPPVAFFDPEHVDEQLTRAAQNYVASNCEVDESSREIRLPIVFRYFEKDFNGPAGIKDFTLGYSDEWLHEQLQRAFEDSYPMVYKRYDWSLNHVI